jgi:ABC-2 type transport system ATP-binding protein
MNIVEIQNLSKVYSPRSKKKRVEALSDFSLNVDSGKIFGLLGPNGAGKTTLVKILLGITLPDEGKAKILGQNIFNYKIKERVGYLPENHQYPSYLTARQVLIYFAKLSNYEDANIEKRIDELLELVKMGKWKNTKLKSYSKGMMQRLGLAQSLINDPELIFLDEPTDGVDPIGRKEIRDILKELKAQGKTIFLNSHLLSEVEMVTDNVAILNNGVMIKEGTVEELTTSKETYQVTLSKQPDEQIIKNLKNDFNVLNVNQHSITLNFEDDNELNNFIDKLRSESIIIKSIVPQKSSLEDMFISLVSESNQEAEK